MRIHGLLALLLLPCAAPAAAQETSLSDALREERSAPPPDSAFLSEAAYCERGRILLDDDRIASILEARTIYRAALADHPDSACAHAGLARALLAVSLQRIEEDDALIADAIAAARRAEAIDGASAEVHAALARALLLDLQPVEADDAARRAIRIAPDSPFALLSAALVFTMTRQNDDARDAIARALAIAPHMPAAYLAEGNLALLEGSEGPALASFKRALTLSPDYLPALLQMAVALEGIGDPRGAADALRLAMERHPGSEARANLFMAIALMRGAGWEKALSILDRIDFSNDRGLGRGTIAWYRAICLERLGRLEEAEKAYREVIEKYPDATAGHGGERLTYKCYEALGRLAMERRAYDEAAAIMEEGAARTRAGLDLTVRLARLYADYNLPQKGADLLAQAVDRPMEPRTARVHLEAYIEWARLLKRLETPEAARRISQSLARHEETLRRLDSTPRDLDAMRALAIAGAGEEALDRLRRAAGRGYTHLGWIDSDPDLESLREAAGYAALVEGAPRLRNPANN